MAPLAGEWIHQATLAIKTETPLASPRHTVAQFPTFSEAYLNGVEALEPEADPRAAVSRPNASVAAILRGMIHATRSTGGGLLVGLSGFGRTVWLQREPHCHRWRAWRTRVPSTLPLLPGGDDGPEGTGAREPRRPRPSGTAGAVALIHTPSTSAGSSRRTLAP